MSTCLPTLADPMHLLFPVAALNGRRARYGPCFVAGYRSGKGKMIDQSRVVPDVGPTLRPMRGKVLIVDDDLDILEALGAILEAHGYAVVMAQNGREALDRFHAGDPPCVIILDLLMPVMSGSEFLAERRDDARLAKTPVVVVTATDTRPMSGADAVLRKPVDLALLLEKIAAACGSRRRPEASM